MTLSLITNQNVIINIVLVNANILIAFAGLMRCKEHRMGWYHSSIGWILVLLFELRYYGMI
jgi:hypothetical protein